MYDAETDEVFLILLEINEATLPAPIRYVHNEEDIVSRGNTYYASFFNLELPTEKADSIDSARITVGNVDQTIIEAARTAIGRPTMTVEIVLASDPDSVEVGPFNFELQSVEYDAQTISGVLAYDDVVEVRSPMHTRTPWFFPDLF
jgi:hypothetical protein